MLDYVLPHRTSSSEQTVYLPLWRLPHAEAKSRCATQHTAEVRPHAAYGLSFNLGCTPKKLPNRQGHAASRDFDPQKVKVPNRQQCKRRRDVMIIPVGPTHEQVC